MTHYLFAVHWDDDRPQGTEEEMAKAYADVEAFNQRLRDACAWIYAGGLMAPDDAQVVDATGANVESRIGSYVVGPRRLGGFLILDAADDGKAHEYAVQASKACNAPVEVRAFQAE
jgi:hypothetical protein